MSHPWPLFDLRVRTPRVELRIPTDDELVTLASVAASGIHHPDWMPFKIAWTDVPSPQLERNLLQWHWLGRATWAPEDWSLRLAVFVDGEPVGAQDVAARDFTTVRSVTTGSWLGRPWQGKGIGKEMRAAVLHLAFAGLDALEAHTGAWGGNAPSRGVTRSLRY